MVKSAPKAMRRRRVGLPPGSGDTTVGNCGPVGTSGSTPNKLGRARGSSSVQRARVAKSSTVSERVRQHCDLSRAQGPVVVTHFVDLSLEVPSVERVGAQ